MDHTLRRRPPPRLRGGVEANASISPVLPLLLLQTMRDMDRPAEVLEAEDLTVSLPRRLGLSDVVLSQIRRFQDEARQKRLQPASSVEDLIRLVGRRPDARAIFEEAGRRMAQHAWRQRGGTLRRLGRYLPRPLAMLRAKRAARRLFGRMVGDSRLRVNRWPPELHVGDALTVRADPGGDACALYAGAYEELLQQYTGRPYRAVHPLCAARGDDHCAWAVRLAG